MSRYEDAQAIYRQGLEKVRTTPEPAGQKYPVGSFVRIAKDLGPLMSHFPSDRFARVEYTYAHAYWGNDVKSYSLTVARDDGSWSSVAWYHEHQLTPVRDPETISQLTSECQSRKSE